MWANADNLFFFSFEHSGAYGLSSKQQLVKLISTIVSLQKVDSRNTGRGKRRSRASAKRQAESSTYERRSGLLEEDTKMMMTKKRSMMEKKKRSMKKKRMKKQEERIL